MLKKLGFEFILELFLLNLLNPSNKLAFNFLFQHHINLSDGFLLQQTYLFFNQNRSKAVFHCPLYLFPFNNLSFLDSFLLLSTFDSPLKDCYHLLQHLPFDPLLNFVTSSSVLSHLQVVLLYLTEVFSYLLLSPILLHILIHLFLLPHVVLVLVQTQDHLLRKIVKVKQVSLLYLRVDTKLLLMPSFPEVEGPPDKVVFRKVDGFALIYDFPLPLIEIVDQVIPSMEFKVFLCEIVDIEGVTFLFLPFLRVLEEDFESFPFQVGLVVLIDFEETPHYVLAIYCIPP
mmetsp:Transcript_41541/g.39951  ORF Transcript_41541/g.39951 Transcript_41541/m.39951 type:complete len:286 (-) Transcript_41541:335-1192(-)